MILKTCVANGYNLLITADHGNAETMIDDNDNPVTKHTTNRGEFLGPYYDPLLEHKCQLTYSILTLPNASGKQALPSVFTLQCPAGIVKN